MQRVTKVLMLALAFVTMLGLAACDTEGVSTGETSTVQEVDDDTGTYGPYLRPNGGIGTGIDMGGGMQYNTQNGRIEFGFGF